MAIINKPNTLNKVFASAGIKVPPDDTKLAQGWTVQQPPYQEFNFLDNRQDQAIAHINQAGHPVWDNVTSYEANYSWVMGSNGYVYACKVTNTNIDPVTDVSESYWKLILNRDSVITYSQTTTYTRNLLTANSAAVARSSLGLTTIGSNIGTATTTSAARTAIGMSGVGSTIVTQGSTASVLSYLGVTSATEVSEGLAERATDAEAISGIDDNRFLTPKKLKLGFSVSLLTNGFIKFPSWLAGFEIRWGSNFVNGNSSQSVTTFPSLCLTAVTSLGMNNTGDFQPPKAYISGTGVTLYNSDSNSITARWIALGY